MQRARQGRLKVNAMASHPAAAGPGGANHQARQLLVRLVARHFEQVLPELLFGVGVGKNILWRLVHAAQVAGVLRIAASPFARRGFEELDRGASLARHQRSTKRGVAAVPAMALPGPDHPLLAGIALLEPTVTRKMRKMGLISRRGRRLSPSAQQLFELFDTVAPAHP